MAKWMFIYFLASLYEFFSCRKSALLKHIVKHFKEVTVL